MTLRPRAAGRSLATAAATLAMVMVAAPVPAHASCVPPGPLSTAVHESAAAFVGTVTATDWGGRRATVRVDEAWKGAVTSPAVVVGTPGGAQTVTSVDRHYDVGVRYLFLPYEKHAGEWRDNDCTSTRPYDATAARLRPKGSASKPISPVVTRSPSATLTPAVLKASGGHSSAWRGIALPASALVVGSGGLLLARRRRPRQPVDHSGPRGAGSD